MDANTSTVARNGIVNVGGTTVTISQSGAAAPASTLCEARFGTLGSALPATGGTGYAYLESTPGCGLTLSSRASWLGLTSTGPQVAYTAGTNWTGAPRIATVAAASTGPMQSIKVLQKGSQSTRFTDVPASHPFADYIEMLAQHGITTTCSAGRFCPDSPTTRGEMAVFLVRAAVGDSFSYGTTPYFEDVPATNPYFRYVQKLRELGYTVGCSTAPARYCVDSGVTRGQVALFLIRMLHGTSFPYSTKAYFADVTTANPVFPYVQKLRDLGITSGCTATEYCESAPNTRGQIAVFVARAFYAE